MLLDIHDGGRADCHGCLVVHQASSNICSSLLGSISPNDRDAALLVAMEDVTPSCCPSRRYIFLFFGICTAAVDMGDSCIVSWVDMSDTMHDK